MAVRRAFLTMLILLLLLSLLSPLLLLLLLSLTGRLFGRHVTVTD